MEDRFKGYILNRLLSGDEHESYFCVPSKCIGADRAEAVCAWTSKDHANPCTDDGERRTEKIITREQAKKLVITKTKW